VDQGYEAQWLKDWAADLKQAHKIDVEVIERQSQGFQVEPQPLESGTHVFVDLQ
jgi:hypothetical protein